MEYKDPGRYIPIIYLHILGVPGLGSVLYSPRVVSTAKFSHCPNRDPCLGVPGKPLLPLRHPQLCDPERAPVFDNSPL